MSLRRLWCFCFQLVQKHPSDTCEHALLYSSIPFKGHTNEKNFAGLYVADGYIACGSETNEIVAYTYHSRWTTYPFWCFPTRHLDCIRSTRWNYGGVQDKLEQSDLVDVQQEIMAHKLDKKDTLRCYSKSSLLVSSPPSSPTHLSHDELDDSYVIPTRGDGNENPEHDANDEPGEVREVTTMYDEDDDGYGEEDEVHEGNDENINLTQEFQHMGIEEKDTNKVMENLVLGFKEGVEVRIPGDETDVNTIGTPEKKQDAVDSVNSVINDSVVQPQNATSDSSATTHALPSISFQTDLPVKHQFGLFSGPSLLPSAVPAIQIRSIQMPLHIHPPVGSSMVHLHHQSQPPLFQFGQLRYTSTVSQGILPITSQTHFTCSTKHLPNPFQPGSDVPKMERQQTMVFYMHGICKNQTWDKVGEVTDGPDDGNAMKRPVLDGL
ncbi:unnamed protein product [Lactuca virosa]|uniref:Uncharacterized protein n=1 Tax=Lactuca virosa TaxID=75947 RepID=A0AAU9LNV7_9ASTR|nr:unnamed protein product [Lactuca virosa]